MMQMLQAGGVGVLTDGQRVADADNPRGYLEVERIKRVKEDSGWLAEAEGKAIKVISMLLYDLPPGHEYRVVFMERDMGEVLASQRAMLARRGGTNAGPGDADMTRHFTNHLAALRAWLARQPHIRVLYLPYRDVLSNPESAMDALEGFLGVALDRATARRAVDPALYRQRQQA